MLRTLAARSGNARYGRPSPVILGVRVRGVVDAGGAGPPRGELAGSHLRCIGLVITRVAGEASRLGPVGDVTGQPWRYRRARAAGRWLLLDLRNARSFENGEIATIAGQVASAAATE
jgi:hypothetical protein